MYSHAKIIQFHTRIKLQKNQITWQKVMCKTYKFEVIWPFISINDQNHEQIADGTVNSNLASYMKLNFLCESLLSNVKYQFHTHKWCKTHQASKGAFCSPNLP